MPDRALPEELVRQLNPVDVRRYAIAEGWQRVEGVNGGIALYQHPDSALDQLIIPLDPAIDDYGQSMAEVIARLAQRASVSEIQILDDLLISACDVLRFRLDEPESQGGSIPLEQGISFLAAAERVLLSAACSVIQPQVFHPRLSRAEAEQLVKACRMEQTERGSFTLKIACPLDAVDLEPDSDKSTPLFDKIAEPEPTGRSVKEPFARQVTRFLMRSVDRMSKAIDADKTDTLLVHKAGEPVLSANLCEALLAMQPNAERSHLALQSTWSRAIAAPPEEEVPTVVFLRSEVFPQIEKLARAFRPATEPRRSKFVALVDSLMGGPDAEGHVQGDVYLMLFDTEGTIRARATLDADQYHTAWEAHGRAAYVTLNGILIRERRIHRIERVSDLKLLSS